MINLAEVFRKGLHGVKAISTEHENKIPFKPIMITSINDDYIFSATCVKKSKLILYPLSDIFVVKINHETGDFGYIPIFIVQSLITSKEKIDYDLTKIYKNKALIFVKNSISKLLYTYMIYLHKGKLYISKECCGVIYHIHNIYIAYDILDKFMIDYRGLIDRGEAIDASTLKYNPYNEW